MFAIISVGLIVFFFAISIDPPLDLVVIDAEPAVPNADYWCYAAGEGSPKQTLSWYVRSAEGGMVKAVPMGNEAHDETPYGHPKETFLQWRGAKRYWMVCRDVAWKWSVVEVTPDLSSWGWTLGWKNPRRVSLSLTPGSPRREMGDRELHELGITYGVEELTWARSGDSFHGDLPPGYRKSGPDSVDDLRHGVSRCREHIQNREIDKVRKDFDFQLNVLHWFVFEYDDFTPADKAALQNAAHALHRVAVQIQADESDLSSTALTDCLDSVERMCDVLEPKR